MTSPADTVEEVMRLASIFANAWHRDESIINPSSFHSPAKEEALRAAVEKLVAERDEARNDLRFVERWANHHASKPTVTAAQALSCIQHYPAIKAITASYADGKVPETRDPWAELSEARLKHKEDAERLREKLVIFACSKHTHKCYICYTEWSEGAPDIHKPDCLLARDGAMTTDPSREAFEAWWKTICDATPGEEKLLAAIRPYALGGFKAAIAWKAEQDRRKPDPLCEALNSGDGVYRP